MKLNDKNFVIGITGGVGAGKSTVLAVLENEYGAHVYQADRISRYMTTKGQRAYDKVVKLFGEEILMPDGNPDRTRMAQIVFNDPEKREALNAIIHPTVCRYLKGKAAGREGLVVLEAALPSESKFPEICDEIWYIYARPNVRIERLSQSRGYTKEKSEEIMASQLSDEEFRSLADVVIDNSGSLDEMEEQIAAQLDRIKSKYNF